MPYVRAILLIGLCAGLVAGGAGCGCRAKVPPPREPDDPRIALVDGRQIVASDLIKEYLKVPAENRAEYAENRKALLDFIINRYIIAAEARAAGVDTQPEVVRQLEEARRFALRLQLDKDLMDTAEPSGGGLAAARAALLETLRAKAQIETHPEAMTDGAQDTAAVAKVGDAAITVGDARRALASMPPGEQARYEADPANLIDALVDNELLVQEALRRGLDKKREFRLRMTRATDAVLVHAMRRRVLEQIKTEISDEELREMAAKEAGGDLPNELIVLYAIVNADRAQVEKALAELDAGKPFSEVHAAYSSEKDPAYGTYSDTTIDQAPEPVADAVRQLKDGEHTGALEIDGRFVLLQVARRPAVVDLEPYREQLLARREDELFLNWVMEKRKQHTIAVNAGRLERVELPGADAAPPNAVPAGP